MFTRGFLPAMAMVCLSGVAEANIIQTLSVRISDGYFQLDETGFLAELSANTLDCNVPAVFCLKGAGGEFEIRTGPVVRSETSEAVGGGFVTVYEVERGTFSGRPHWKDANGIIRSDYLEVVLPRFTFELTDPIECPPPFRCGDIAGQVALGAGAMGPLLAGALGTNHHIRFGEIEFTFDQIGGRPGDAVRVGFVNAQLSIPLNVPEPSGLSLLVTAALLWVGRARRH